MHTHIGEIESLDRMISIEEEFGITSQIAIVHSEKGPHAIREMYSDRFVFAKYLPVSEISQFHTDSLVEAILKMKEEGFTLAKMWFGPRWRDYVEDADDTFQIDDLRLEPVFETLEQEGIPLLIHVADPDTYFKLHYKDTEKYGTKDENLAQLETVLERYPKLLFQIPHFGAQPEIHRLPHLATWLDRFSNIYIDTASSRWMARELSKDVEKAREFLLKYSDRILFGTDCSSNGIDSNYFAGRYTTQRLLWETDVRDVSLPIPDPDTKDTCGTFINGLDLPFIVNCTNFL